MKTACRILAPVTTLLLCFLAATAPSWAQGVRYEVTESVTNQRITGWEHNLTDRDPNLGHWHWEPISTSAHRMNVNRIATPGTPNPADQQFTRSHYVKPIHVPLPTVAHNCGSNSNGSERSSADLAGKLLKKNNSAAITAQAKPVAAYEDYSKQEYANNSGAAAREHVAGTIIHKSGRRAAYNQTPTYF